MEKITKDIKGEYSNTLTDSFRELVADQIGKLDTATSFMYLYRRFEEPTLTNKDEYKILYEYIFKHEDIIVTIHASYHEHVMFSLNIPKKRLDEWFEKRTEFFKQLYEKYSDIPFMPYAQLPFGGDGWLAKEQHEKNWDLINKSSEKFFSKEDSDYIEKEIQSQKPNVKVWEMLRPFESKLCKDFRAKLTKEELEEVNSFMPKIENISGLKEQCMFVINELKKGCYVRDVAINILGYESKTNVVSEYIGEGADILK